MFVKSIELASPTSDPVASPSWDIVEEHLRSLDGGIKDGVILDSYDKSYMGVSGGRTNQYIVAGYLDGYGSFILASGEMGLGRKEVAVAGDLNFYESENVVGLGDAIVAAKVFFERGALAEQFKWEKWEKKR